jgi:hypothetical protein
MNRPARLLKRVRHRLTYNRFFPSAQYRYLRSYRALLKYLRQCGPRAPTGAFLEHVPFVGSGTRQLGNYLATAAPDQVLYLYRPLLAGDIDAGNVKVASEAELQGLSFCLVSMHYDPGNDDLPQELQWAVEQMPDGGSLAIHNTDSEETARILQQFKSAHRDTLQEVFRQGATVVLQLTPKRRETAGLAR